MQRIEDVLARDGLHDVVGGSEREGLAAFVEHRDDHHGQRRGRRFRLQAGEHIPPVQAREQQVEEHGSRPQGLRQAQALLAVGGHAYREPGILQIHAQQVGGTAVVLDDEDERAIGVCVCALLGRLAGGRRQGHGKGEAAAIGTARCQP